MNQEIERHLLENGLEVGFVSMPASPTACIHVRGLAGSNYEDLNEIGVAHLLEHIVVDSPSFSVLSKMAKIVAICSRDDVLYGIKIANENILEILPVFLNIFESDLTGLNHLEQHKIIVKNEISRHVKNPEKHIIRAIYKTLYPNTRMSIFNTGDIEHINNIDQQTLEKYYIKKYTPSQFVVTISGNLDKEVKEIILNYLSQTFTTHKKQKPLRNYVKHEKSDKKISQTIKMAQAASEFLKYNYYGVDFRNPLKYSLTVLAKLLESKLLKLQALPGVYKSSCTSFSTGSYGIFDFALNLETKMASSQVQYIYELIQNMQFSENEIYLAKENTLNKFLLSIDKTTNLTDYYSELMLHGTNEQSMKYEQEQIRDTDQERIDEAILYLRNQTPKITVLTP